MIPVYHSSTYLCRGGRLFALAGSLGDVESLSNHPASMTHAGILKEEKEWCGLPDSLIRPSAGTKDVDNLLTGPERPIG